MMLLLCFLGLFSFFRRFIVAGKWILTVSVALLSCCGKLSVLDFTGRTWTAEPSGSK